MAETRWLNERYHDIAARLIAEEPALSHIDRSDVEIAFLSSDAKKTYNGKVVFGQCEKVPAKWKWAVPCDFAIVVFEPNVEGFDEERLRILLLHELMHVGIDDDGEKVRYFIVSHDIEEFSAIIDRFGTGWHLAAPA